MAHISRIRGQGHWTRRAQETRVYCWSSRAKYQSIFGTKNKEMFVQHHWSTVSAKKGSKFPCSTFAVRSSLLTIVVVFFRLRDLCEKMSFFINSG